MKTLTLCTALIISVFLSACDVQSGMTKKGLEEYNPTPTPKINIPTPEPIDPADSIEVDVAQTGPQISINKAEPNKTVNCDKYNRVTINGNEREVTIKGACKQIMINGDRNKVTAHAAAEIVLNGTENTVQYTKYANGKRPVIAENSSPNTVEKIQEPAGNQKPGKTAKD